VVEILEESWYNKPANADALRHLKIMPDPYHFEGFPDLPGIKEEDEISTKE